MKIHILYAAAGALYAVGAILDAPDDVAKGLIDRGDAEKAPKGSVVTGEWPVAPEPEPVAGNATDAQAIEAAVSEAIAKTLSAAEADKAAAIEALKAEHAQEIAELTAQLAALSTDGGSAQ